MGHICDYKSVVTWSLCQPRVAQTYSPLPPLSAMLIKLGVNLRLVQSVAIWINCSCGNSLIIEDEPESTGRNMFTPPPPLPATLSFLSLYSLSIHLEIRLRFKLIDRKMTTKCGNTKWKPRMKQNPKYLWLPTPLPHLLLPPLFYLFAIIKHFYLI